jgi:hypothetical protein
VAILWRNTIGLISVCPEVTTDIVISSVVSPYVRTGCSSGKVRVGRTSRPKSRSDNMHSGIDQGSGWTGWQNSSPLEKPRLSPPHRPQPTQTSELTLVNLFLQAGRHNSLTHEHEEVDVGGVDTAQDGLEVSSLEHSALIDIRV